MISRVQHVLQAYGINNFTRLKSNFPHYSVTEVKVPTLNGHISGKLWQSKQQSLRSVGSSSIPILALHGWVDNCGTFDPLIPLIMQPNMTIFAWDFPGHGRSSHTSSSTYDSHLEVMTSIHRILKHFGWEKVTLLGHSLGAINSFIFSAAYPQCTHRYIALDNHRPVVRDYITSLQSITKKLFDTEKKLNSKTGPPTYTYDEIVRRFYDGRHHTISIEGCRALLRRGSIKIGEDKYRFSHDLRAVIPSGAGRFSKEQTEQIARKIKCPICIIKGNPGHNYEPIEEFLGLVEIMKENNENVEFHWVPGTHHFHLNDPQAVAPIIRKFLEQEF